MKVNTSVKTLKEIEESIEVKKGGTFRAKVTSLGIPLTVEIRVCYQKAGVYMSYFKDKGVPIVADTSKKELAKKLADFLKKLGWQDKEEVEEVEELNLEAIEVPKKKYVRASIKAQPLKKRNITEELKEYVRNKHPNLKVPAIISMAIGNPALHKNTGSKIYTEKKMRTLFWDNKMDSLLRAINSKQSFLGYGYEDEAIEYDEQREECFLEEGDKIFSTMDGKNFIRIH